VTTRASRTKKTARLDELLVARGLAADVAEARALVMAGQVVVRDQREDKPGTKLPVDVALRVKDAGGKYVSRAGEKLAHALADLGLETRLAGAVVLDVGASTGGFTEVCLEAGAKHVIALDVGTAQLDWALRQDARVTSLEQTDVRAFDPAAHPAVDFVVADVSFNALARLAPAIRKAAPAAGVGFLVLVKPQFELPRAAVPEGGVVDDEGARAEAVARVQAAFAAQGLGAFRSAPSKVAGRTGNREVFLYAEAPQRA
jgi:23S rRNA (cytidine1920-2'-O)/16S rRNA (cytidine1409-2'-O)-methyltransferase